MINPVTGGYMHQTNQASEASVKQAATPQRAPLPQDTVSLKSTAKGADSDGDRD